jgi:hypothetical protein
MEKWYQPQVVLVLLFATGGTCTMVAVPVHNHFTTPHSACKVTAICCTHAPSPCAIESMASGTAEQFAPPNHHPPSIASHCMPSSPMPCLTGCDVQNPFTRSFHESLQIGWQEISSYRLDPDSEYI